jgi:hypothetical protein
LIHIFYKNKDDGFYLRSIKIIIKTRDEQVTKSDTILVTGQKANFEHENTLFIVTLVANLSPLSQ